MIALHTLHVENFRSLAKVSVPLGHLNVLVGPNAAGKSSLLEVIGFLGDVARMDLGPAVLAHGGWSSLRFRGTGGRPRAPIRISVEAQVTRHSSDVARDVYTLEFSENPRISGFMKRSETFKFKRTAGAGRRITATGSKFEVVDELRGTHARSLNENSAALATLQKLGEEEGAPQVRELAGLFETFRVFEVDVAAARKPATLTKRAALASNASNLADFLVSLHEQHQDVFRLLEEDLSAIVPGVERIRLEPVGGTTTAVKVALEERALKGTTDLAFASFGTVRALALLSMLHDPSPPKLSCVEEIDHGLHPHALDRIVERLRSAARRTQIILATHSPALVNRLEPEEIIVCERDVESGASRIPAIDAETVRAIFDADSLGLGELWFSGTLGGVP